MSKTFVSGKFDSKTRSECMVEYKKSSSGGVKVKIESKIKSLYGKSILEDAEETLADLKIKNCSLQIQDGGALDFVIKARIEAAVKAAHPDLNESSLPKMKKHCKYKSKRDRFRRSRLYLPGTQAKLMLNAGLHTPDAVILDLEDSVAPSEKDSARLIVRNALRTLDFFGAERMVRINQGDLGLKDLEEIAAHNVHLVLIPKVESADDVIKVDEKIKSICKEAGHKEPVYLMPILESARGILKALEIAEASDNNVALAIGLEDYTADIGTERTLTGKESFFARSMLVNAARAAGIQAIDTVFSDVGDMDGLRTSVIEAKELGFDGKGCIHPRQIKPIHDAFTPTEPEIKKAQKIVLAFDDAESRGLGVVSLGSKMIDPPVVKRAQKIVELALASKTISKDWKSQ